jgi:hypothetical protein
MSEFAEGYAIGQGTNTHGNGFGGWGGDGWWILLLLLCGWGNGNWNNGGNNMNYEIGRLATTNDVASGFSTSTIMSTQRDTQLEMNSGFANVQQTLCQGFNGINQSISDCCCRTQQAIADVKYANERNTCDIIQANNANTQRIIDYLNCQEMNNLRNENQTLRLQASQSAQNAYLIDQLRPTARPAYLTCSPFDSAYGYNRGGSCGCSGLGSF